MHKWSFESRLVDDRDLKPLEVRAYRNMTKAFRKLKGKEVTGSWGEGGIREGFVEEGTGSPGGVAVSTWQAEGTNDPKHGGGKGQGGHAPCRSEFAWSWASRRAQGRRAGRGVLGRS